MQLARFFKNNLNLFLFLAFLLFYTSQTLLSDQPNRIQLLSQVSKLMSEQQYQEALEILKQLQQEYPQDIKVKGFLFQIYETLKDYGELEKLVWEQIQKNPEDINLWVRLGEFQLKQGKQQEAAQSFEKIIQTDPSQPNLYLLVASFYTTSGFFQEAANIYLEARRRLQRPTLFAFELADLYESQREYGKAIEEYFSYLREDSSSYGEVEIRVLNLIETREQIEQIKQTLEGQIKKYPQSWYAYKLLGDYYLKNEDLKPAFENYKTVDLLTGTQGRFLLLFIRECVEQKSYKIAEEAGLYLLSKYEKPYYRIQAQFYLAKTYREMGKIEPAKNLYQELSNTASDREQKAEALFELGEIEFQNLNNFFSGLEQFRKAFKLDPKGTWGIKAQMRIGDCFLASGYLDSAQIVYDKLSVSGFPVNFQEEARFKLADLQFYLKNFDSAWEMYRKLVSDFPKGFFANDALHRLALILENQTSNSTWLEKFAQALFLLKQVRISESLDLLTQIQNQTENNLSDASSWEKAQVYYIQKDWSKAKENLDMLLRTNPRSIFCADALLLRGDINFEEGRKEKALLDYQEILDKYPDCLFLDKVREKIKRIQKGTVKKTS